jgi:hypothetical protein
MVKNIKGSLLTIKDMEKEFSNGLMGNNIMANGIMENNMV